MKKIKYIVMTVLLAASLNSSAQADKTIVNDNFWGGFEMQMPLYEGSKWGLYAEGYIKRANFMENPMSWFWRLGGTYYLKSGNRISGGLAYQFNFPYDEAMLPYGWPDWRIWQQYMIRIPSKRNPNHQWVHRIRPEERFLGRRYDNSTRTEGWDYYKFEFTLRYMLRSQWYLTKRFALAVYDELHLRLLSSKPNENLVDQNRIYGGIVYALDKKRIWRIETGYMFQSVWNAADEQHIRTRINHTWRLTFAADMPLGKRNKKTN